MTWSQSVYEALCYGLIDSARNSIDADRCCIRFIPPIKTIHASKKQPRVYSEKICKHEPLNLSTKRYHTLKNPYI